MEVVDPITQKTEKIKAYVYFQGSIEERAADLPKGLVQKFRKFPRGDWLWLDEDVISDSYAEENTVTVGGRGSVGVMIGSCKEMLPCLWSRAVALGTRCPMQWVVTDFTDEQRTQMLLEQFGGDDDYHS